MHHPLSHSLPHRHTALALLLTALLAGCAAGTDYRSPSQPAPDALPTLSAPLRSGTADAA